MPDPTTVPEPVEKEFEETLDAYIEDYQEAATEELKKSDRIEKESK